LKLVNMVSHDLNFTDGTTLTQSGFIAEVDWIDEEKEYDGLILVKRMPVITEEQLKNIELHLNDGEFGIVSFPCVSAIRGTRLEGKVGSVIMENRKEKIALPNKFSI